MIAVDTGLKRKKNTVPTARTVPTVAVGTRPSLPTAILCQRPVCSPAVDGFYADGHDLWPSA